MNPILMRAVLDALAFAELSSDDVIDPDAAVKLLEQTAATLQQLSSTDRAAFIAFTQKMAEEEAQVPGNTARVEFLRRQPEALGLVDDSD